jgi:hypothetical protein
VATQTSNLKLIKPADGEPQEINDLNFNFDQVDKYPGVFKCTSTTRPASPFTGLHIYETNTKRTYVWDGIWRLITWPEFENIATNVSAGGTTWACELQLLREGPEYASLTGVMTKLGGALSLAASAAGTSTGINVGSAFPSGWSKVSSRRGYNGGTAWFPAIVAGAGMNTQIQVCVDSDLLLLMRTQATVNFLVNSTIWIPPIPVTIAGA